MLDIKYDLELIAQFNQMELLKRGIETKEITPESKDALSRTLAFQCVLFGNLSMLKYLVEVWGEQILFLKDKLNTTLTHMASRNGCLEILKYLDSNNAILNEQERRFQIAPLDLVRYFFFFGKRNKTHFFFDSRVLQ